MTGIVTPRLHSTECVFVFDVFDIRCVFAHTRAQAVWCNFMWCSAECPIYGMHSIHSCKLLCVPRTMNVWQVHFTFTTYVYFGSSSVNRILGIRVFRHTCTFTWIKHHILCYSACKRNVQLIANSVCTSSGNSKWNIFRKRCQSKPGRRVQWVISFDDRGQKRVTLRMKSIR